MHISDTQLAISVFVCADEAGTTSKRTRVPKATAFLTVLRGDPFWTGYIVTTAHVIEEVGRQSTYLRINTDEGFDDVEIQPDEWFIHEHADVALVRVKWSGRKPYQLHSIYPEQFVEADLRIKPTVLTPVGMMTIHQPIGLQVQTGDQVSIVGLFSQNYGTAKSLPIARAGTVARLPSTPIRFRRRNGKYSNQPSYLIEAHSHGGLSGSPVYVHRRAPAIRQIPVSSIGHEGSTDKAWIQDPDAEVIAFLGLVTGHFDIDQIAGKVIGVDAKVSVAINSGIAVVTPAECVKELLSRADVLKDRERAHQLARRATEVGLEAEPDERAIFHYVAE